MTTARHERETTGNVPSLVIVSDVRLYRDGLTVALALRADVAVLGTAADMHTARAAATTLTPDVVLLDTGMPHALDLARALRAAVPGTKVLAFAVTESGTDVVACAEAGIAGYVSRDAAIDDVVAAVRDVVRGELRCSPKMAAELFERLATLSAARPAPARSADVLTDREREIVVLIDEGLSNKDIGRRLQIGTATVKNHVHNILEKLQVRRRSEAAARVRG